MNAFYIPKYWFLAGAILLLTLVPVLAQPVITCRPSNQTALAGSTVTYTVCATGTPPLTYQWRSYLNANSYTNIPFGTQATLMLTNVQATSRRFGVEVSNVFGSVTSTLATLTVTQTPPVLVSASSVNGAEIGVCFSREMNATDLSIGGNYQVLGSAGSVPVVSVLPWVGNTSVVLRLSAPVSGSFRVSAQSIRDLAGALVSSASVTGRVWGQTLSVARVGTAGTPPQLLTLDEGRLTMRGEGGLYGGGPSTFDFLSENRTNDFDVQVRVDSISKPTSPLAPDVGSSLVAEAGLMLYDASNPSGPSLAFVAMPTNGSRMFMFRIWDTTTSSPVTYGNYTWAASSEGFPIWLRVRRAGSSFLTYDSTNGTDWTSVGDPVTLPAGPIMQVGLVTVSFISGVYATADYRDYDDTRLTGVVVLTRNPADVTVEENQSASFTAEATVTGASTEDLIYQWQAETAIGSGLFTNIFLASSLKYVTPRLSQADSGLRVRLLARVGGGVPVVSLPARLTVTPDRTPPTVISATTRKGRNSVEVTYSEPVQSEGALDIFSYVGNDFTPSDVRQDETGRKLTLTLDAPLDPTTSHDLTIGQIDIRDLAGNLLAPNPTHVTVTTGTPQRGVALQELFYGVNSLASMRFGSGVAMSPDSRSLVTQLEGPMDFAEDYGTRISGLLIPPASGNYNFWMCSDDEGEFWLSTDEEPAHLQKLCREPSWNGSRQFATLARRDASAPENRSSTLFPLGIPLVAGQRYYFEALSVEFGGGDNLSVAWQVPGGPAPLDGDAPIPGTYLSCFADPVNAAIQITRQPSNATAVSFIPVSGVSHLIFSEDFLGTNGGFSAAQSGNPRGPWRYDIANGVWSADGTDDLPPSEKLLTSPFVTVTQGGEVRLRFQHRFNFQEDLIDGGQVRMSRNGGPFFLVPLAAFKSNGYSGVLSTDMLPGIPPGFGNTSPGYAIGAYLTSEASLGVLNTGDRLAIQFRGLWDWNTVKPGPNWAIKSIELTEGHPGRTEATFAVQATATRADNEPAPIFYAWQRDCGTGFSDIPGANEALYRFAPAVGESGCRYRCLLFTLGATATSAEATLTLVLPPLNIERSGREVILTWPGQATLQSAPTPTGPWSTVDNATSPQHRTIGNAPRQFYRLSDVP